MPQAITLGELLIDFVASATDVGLEEAPGFVRAPGGAPANVAAGLAKLGLPAGFIGKVGDDPFGRFLRRTMADAGVDVTHTILAPEARTTLAFVASWSDGHKDICFYRHPGADILLEPQDIDAQYLSTAAVFHFGSVSLSQAPSRDATIHAVSVARNAGAFVSYDPNLRLGLWDSPEEAKQWIWHVMGRAHLAKLAEEEWQFITGTDSLEEGSKRLFDKGVELVVVTRGEKGCYFDNSRYRGHVEGLRVDTVDALGAGDGFVAAMLSRFIRSTDGPLKTLRALDEAGLRDIMQYANVAGALTTTKIGVIPALPTEQEIAVKMKAH